MRREDPPRDAKQPEKDAAGKKVEQPISAEERLQMLVTLSYPRITLDQVMHRISTEIGVPITIVTETHGPRLEIFPRIIRCKLEVLMIY